MLLLRNSKVVFMEPLRIVEPIAWIKHIPFAFFITELHKPRIFVELGVHTGNSFSAFCQAVKALNLKCSCYGVDNFKGDPHTGFYEESVYFDVNNYITETYGDFAQLMKMDFDEALKYFSDRSIDLLHIDGYHTYEAVKHDFESWIKKMSDRGVILLHDTQVRRDEFGVWKLWEELSGKYPSYEFNFGYGLGIVVVGDKAYEVLNFIEEAKKEPFIEGFFRLIGATLELKHLLKNHKGRVSVLEEQLKQRDSSISELQRQISGLKEEIERIRESLKSKEYVISELESKLKEREREIKVKEEEILRLQKENEKLSEEFERREIEELSLKINEKDLALKKNYEEVESLKASLKSKEAEIARLNEELIKKDAELQSIKSSFTCVAR